MPNAKRYYIKDRYYDGIELTPGEQLILIKKNLKLLKEQKNATSTKS